MRICVAGAKQAMQSRDTQMGVAAFFFYSSHLETSHPLRDLNSEDIQTVGKHVCNCLRQSDELGRRGAGRIARGIDDLVLSIKGIEHAG